MLCLQPTEKVAQLSLPRMGQCQVPQPHTKAIVAGPLFSYLHQLLKGSRWLLLFSKLQSQRQPLQSREMELVWWDGRGWVDHSMPRVGGWLSSCREVALTDSPPLGPTHLLDGEPE